MNECTICKEIISLSLFTMFITLKVNVGCRKDTQKHPVEEYKV